MGDKHVRFRYRWDKCVPNVPFQGFWYEREGVVHAKKQNEL